MPTQEEIARGASKPKKRGQVKNQSRLEAFKKSKEVKGNADWGNAKPEHVLGVIEAMQRVGGAITFGLSRDGGAYMITLLLDGDRETLWFNGDCDLEVELRAVYETLDSMG